MTADNKIQTPPPPSSKRAPTLYLIIAIKFLKGAGLLLLAVGVYMLRNKDLQDVFDNSLQWLHLDPENKFFNGIGDWLNTVTPSNVKFVASGAFLYGMLLTVEGFGLAFHKRWAVWLVVGQSAFFVPVEIYDLLRRHKASHSSWPVLTLLGINLLIVWYLLKNRERLFPPRRH